MNEKIVPPVGKKEKKMTLNPQNVNALMSVIYTDYTDNTNVNYFNVH